MSDKDSILHDSYPIQALHLGPLSLGPASFILGHGDIKSIEPYQESGEMGHVTWFRVLNHAGHVIFRVNAAHVHIVAYRERL